MSPKTDALACLVYERGEGRHKHVWKNDYAGFVPSGRGAVGKCASSISESIATGLLQSGVAESDPFDAECAEPPTHIYNIYRGVPYVAVPTRPGASYHGYPYRGRLDPDVRACLRARAEQAGTLREFEKWLRVYCAS